MSQILKRIKEINDEIFILEKERVLLHQNIRSCRVLVKDMNNTELVFENILEIRQGKRYKYIEVQLFDHIDNLHNEIRSKIHELSAFLHIDFQSNFIINEVFKNENTI